MILRVVSAGRLKTPGARAWVEHYQKRISFWKTRYRIEMLEVKSGADDSSRVHSIIFKASPPRSVRILLDESGVSLTSHEWAKKFENWERDGIQVLLFGIGGSFGFRKGTLGEADLVLSLGRGTLSHELARMILLEQLYRTCAIRMGHPYHHD